MKILVLSHNSFSKTYNNGKTLSAIFSAFKAEELAQLFFTAKGEPDYERCVDYYYISDKDALKSILKRNKCGKVLPFSSNAVEHESCPNRKNVHLVKMKKGLRSLVWMFSAWYRGGLYKWLFEQKPNAIFFVGGDSYFSHYIAVSLSKKLKIPLATYFTDDYILNTPTDIYNRLLKCFYKRTIDSSSRLYAIGKQMAEDYSLFYHREFKPIMNIVEIPKITDFGYFNKDSISINYFGGLHLGRTWEIMRFARFMRKFVAPLINKKISIGIYSFSSLTDSEREEMSLLGVLTHKGLTGEELQKRMKETDILLHVESSQRKYYALTKLSVSTKIPEYMCIAKPIIAFGPSDVASFRVIADACQSFVIADVEDEKTMTQQARRVAEILETPSLMEQIAYNNYIYAKQHFDIKVVSNEFRSDIINLNGGKK